MPNPRLFIPLLLLLPFISIYGFGQQQQISETYLSSPRKASHTFMHWQQEGHQNFDRVILTFKLSSADAEEKEQMAIKLRKILDARGLLVV